VFSIKAACNFVEHMMENKIGKKEF
jgi:hypothetical protein